MRLEIILQPDKPLDLPIHYGSHLRGFVYSYLEPKVSEYLHDHGYQQSTNSSSYKMFSYSRLSGHYSTYHHQSKKQKRIVFDDKISFMVSAIDAEDIQPDTAAPQLDTLLGFAQNLLSTQNPVELNGVFCQVIGVTIVNSPIIKADEAIKIRMISPITIHRTFKYCDDSKGTYYYYPFEQAWQEKIFNNLENKAKALHWQNPKIPEDSYIKPICVNRADKKIINDLGFWIEGWLGEYEILLPENFFWLAYKAGFGSRNSGGFGLFEVI